MSQSGQDQSRDQAPRSSGAHNAKQGVGAGMIPVFQQSRTVPVNGYCHRCLYLTWRHLQPEPGILHLVGKGL